MKYRWEVIRESGRRNGQPRTLYMGDDELRARAVYGREAERLRQGSVKLYEFTPATVRHLRDNCSAPRLRTRW